MNIRQLKYFVKVYESGSFFRAAEALFISQQALSRALATLEQDLNAPLFYRNHKGVVPTALGRELYASCQPALREMAVLDRHIEEFVRLNYGQLKIGLAAGCRYFNSKTVWRDFLAEHPALSFNVEEYPYRKGVELLEEKELDILIVSDYDTGEDYYQCELKTLNRVLLLPREHPLCQRDYAGFEDLKDESFVLSINDLAFDHLMDFFDRYRCRPKEVLRVSDTLYMYEACSRDQCAGITIDGYFTDIFLSKFPNLQTLPFRENLFPYTITLAARADHPRISVIAALGDYLKAYLEDKK